MVVHFVSFVKFELVKFNIFWAIVVLWAPLLLI